MRKLFNIDQDEKNRILEMHENATKRHYLNEYSGVAFGGEQNGLKIEKVEATEQSNTSVQQKTAGDIGVASKPTYVNNDIKYYVPGLDDNTFTKFVEFNQFDSIPQKLANLKALNVNANLDPGYNAIAVPQETFDKQFETYTQRLMQGQGPDTAMKDLGIVRSVNFLENTLAGALKAYLNSWSPNQKGIAVLNSPVFAQNPLILTAKKYIKNFDEVFPKVLKSQSTNSGLTLV